MTAPHEVFRPRPTPPGLTVNLAYNASANAPTNAGSYQVIGTISDIVYAGGATNNPDGGQGRGCGDTRQLEPDE